MKKYVAILFILFFSLNSLIITTYFYAQKSSIKNEMKKFIKQNINFNDFEKIIINQNDKNFIRIDKQEFRYKGKLYDIKKEIHQNGKIIFYCINDLKEEILLKNFSLFNGNNDKFISIITLSKILNNSFIPLFIKISNFSLIQNQFNIKYVVFISHYISTYLEPLIPPPKY